MFHVRNANSGRLNRLVDFVVLGATFYVSCMLLSVELGSSLFFHMLAYSTILLAFVLLSKRAIANYYKSIGESTRKILGNAIGILIGTCIILLLEKLLSNHSDFTVAIILSGVLAFFVLGILCPFLMKWIHSIIVVSTFLSLSIIAGCHPQFGVEQVDLVPERRPGSQGENGFCNGDNSQLFVRVRNQSNIDAIEITQTRVRFPNGVMISLDTPQLAGGSFANVGPFPIPPGCFNADCSFTIEVDATSLLPNEHDHNNLENGICIG